MSDPLTHDPRDADYVVVMPVVHKEGSTRDPEWRWVRYSANHKALSESTEGYEDHGYTIEMAKSLNPGMVVQDAEGNLL